jgi:UDP-N-acetylglucosamine transferase subunit ALG13
MQIGTSRTPDRVAWVTYLAHDDLERLMTEAAAIVCHGGPGTIIASLSAGKMPIVVPRTHALGEHVDDHQVRFAGRLEQLGYAFVAEERARFEYLLTQAISGASGFIAPQLQARTARSVEAFGQVIEERLNISPRNASPR